MQAMVEKASIAQWEVLAKRWEAEEIAGFAEVGLCPSMSIFPGLYMSQRPIVTHAEIKTLIHSPPKASSQSYCLLKTGINQSPGLL
jgi:hypothetical protein